MLIEAVQNGCNVTEHALFYHSTELSWDGTISLMLCLGSYRNKMIWQTHSDPFSLSSFECFRFRSMLFSSSLYDFIISHF